MGAAALGFGVSALQGISQHKRDSELAEVQEAQRNVDNQEVQSALLSSFRSLEDEADQLGENFIANDIDRQKMEAKARGAAVANAGASRAGGTTLDMQLDDISVASSINQSRNVMNREREMGHIKSKGAESVNVANARFNRMQVQQPKLDLLGIGVSGFRNSIALQGASDSFDSVFGADSSTLDPSTLVDSPVHDNLLRTA